MYSQLVFERFLFLVIQSSHGIEDKSVVNVAAIVRMTGNQQHVLRYILLSILRLFRSEVTRSFKATNKRYYTLRAIVLLYVFWLAVARRYTSSQSLKSTTNSTKNRQHSERTSNLTSYGAYTLQTIKAIIKYEFLNESLFQDWCGCVANDEQIPG